MLPANDLFLDDSIVKQISIVSDDETINLTNSNIHSEQFTLKESICTETSLKIGSCESNSIEFTIDNNVPSMSGKWLTVTITPYNRNGTAGTAMPLGRFKVFSDKPSGDRQTRTIIAYDKLFYVGRKNYKRWYRRVAFSNSSTLTIKQFRDAFFERIGVTQVSATLANDSVSIKKVKVASKLTGKDILTAICEINGVFGHMTRDGEFKYIKLSTSTSATNIPKDYTIKVEYNDESMSAVDRVEMLGKDGELIAGVGQSEDDATNKYTIDNNFLINGMSSVNVQKSALQAMKGVINSCSFVPVTAEMKGHPRYEIGDRIKYNVGNTTKTSFILNREMTGIQALYDTYGSQVDEYYSNEPYAVNTKSADMQSMEYQIGAMEDMTECHLEKMDDGSIVIRDENLAGDEDYGDTCTRSFCMWTKNNLVNPTGQHNGTWATYRVEIKSDHNFYIVDCRDPQDDRHTDINGKTYNAMETWLVYKIPHDASRPILYEKNTLIDGNNPDFHPTTRFDSDSSVPFGQWGNAFTVNRRGSDFVTVNGYDYIRTSHWYGSPFSGLYGMSRADRHYPSKSAFNTAFYAGEINPPALKNGDIVIPSGTAQQAELDGLLELANSIDGTSGGGSGDERNTNTANIDNIPQGGTGTDVASNDKQLLINNAINTIKNGLDSWIGDIERVNTRGNIIANVQYRGASIADKPLYASTNLTFVSEYSPQSSDGADNDIYCVVGDVTGIKISTTNTHQYYNIGESVDTNGYQLRGSTQHSGSEPVVATCNLIYKVEGLTVGNQYTFTYSVRAVYSNASTGTDSNVTYDNTYGYRYGYYGLLYSDSINYSTTGLPAGYDDTSNTWYANLRWQNFANLTKSYTSFSNTITATATTMYLVFMLDPITRPSEPVTAVVDIMNFKTSESSFQMIAFYAKKDGAWYPLNSGSGGTMNYESLENLPEVNGNQLIGNKTTRDLGMIEETTQEAYDLLPTADQQNPDKVYYVKDGSGGGGGGGGGGSSTLAGLTDVSLTSPTDGQVLAYDAVNQLWKNSSSGGGGGGSSTLAGLSDVDITSPSNGQILAYNSTSQKWENAIDSKKSLFWDFTQCSLDMNFFSPANLSNATIGENGATMTSTSGYIEFSKYLLRKNMTYEVKFGTMNITDTTRQNNIFRFKNLTSNNEAGFLYRYQTLKWVVWDSVNSWQESEITDKDYFNNSTMKIKTLSDGKWEIYKDDVLVFTTPLSVTFEGTDSWGIGSPTTGRSVTGMVVESVKIYHNN